MRQSNGSVVCFPSIAGPLKRGRLPASLLREMLPRVGGKRYKEPSSYAQTSGGGQQRTQQKSSEKARSSLHQSFSNLSLKESSKALSLWAPKESLQLSTRDRSDSNASRESDTSALDRFLTKHYEPGVIKLSAKVSEKNGLMEFIINLSVKDFGSKEWFVLRSVDDVVRFCERVRLAGVGLSFPMPPPPEEVMQCITKAQTALSMVPSLGLTESHESTSTQNSRLQSKPRHQKKRVNSGVPGAASSSTSTSGIIRAMSTRLSIGRSSTKKQPHERRFPSVQEWFDAALEVWQRRWHSKSDEDGISLAFEGFLCDPTGKTSAPVDLLTAVDFVVLVTASAPNSNPALLLNKKREATIAKVAMRLAREYPDVISVDALKARVLSYAWAQFEAHHPMSIKELIAAQNSFVTMSQEELPYMQLQVHPIVTQASEYGVRFAYKWTPHPQLASLKWNLIENFSVPPTPRSFEHFNDVWKNFSDVVILRVEQRLQELAMQQQQMLAAGQMPPAASSSYS